METEKDKGVTDAGLKPKVKKDQDASGGKEWINDQTFSEWY